jgi:hypothetical protein
MNVRLRYEIIFTAGVYYDDAVLFNNYIASLNLVTNTASTVEQNIALARMKYFVHERLEHSVFVQDSEQDQIRRLDQAHVKVSNLPESPVDQVIGIALLSKLNAVMEQRLIVLSVDISSDLGDCVVYCHSVDEPGGPLEQDGWWQRSDLSHYDHKILNRNQRIIKINRNLEWRDVDLDWQQTPQHHESNIVIANFPKNADE